MLNKKQVIRLLKRGPMSITDIVFETLRPVEEIKSLLQGMETEGIVEKRPSSDGRSYEEIDIAWGLNITFFSTEETNPSFSAEDQKYLDAIEKRKQECVSSTDFDFDKWNESFTQKITEELISKRLKKLNDS